MTSLFCSRWIRVNGKLGLFLLAGCMSLLVPAPVAGQSWKGINYYPRGHEFYNMLNDWYNYDANAGGYYVRNSVINDMALLHSNGVNFLHLYLWDSQFYGTGLC